MSKDPSRSFKLSRDKLNPIGIHAFLCALILKRFLLHPKFLLVKQKTDATSLSIFLPTPLDQRHTSERLSPIDLMGNWPQRLNKASGQAFLLWAWRLWKGRETFWAVLCFCGHAHLALQGLTLGAEMSPWGQQSMLYILGAYEGKPYMHSQTSKWNIYTICWTVIEKGSFKKQT